MAGITKNWSSPNVSKSIVGFDASQLNPYVICQPMPTGFYRCWELDVDIQPFKPRSNKTRSFENMLRAHFQISCPDCRIESFHTPGSQKKNWWFQRWWILWSLWHKFRGYCLLLLILWVSGNTFWSHRWRHSQRTKQKNWIIYAVYTCEKQFILS